MSAILDDNYKDGIKYRQCGSNNIKVKQISI